MRRLKSESQELGPPVIPKSMTAGWSDWTLDESGPLFLYLTIHRLVSALQLLSALPGDLSADASLAIFVYLKSVDIVTRDPVYLYGRI